MATDGEDSSNESSDPIRTVPTDADPEQFPRALAARIGNRDVWIANSGGVDPANFATMNLDPAYVVSVNHRPSDATTDHHPLKDGYVNDRQEFRGAVEATRNRLQKSGSVIVNCAAGISRSTTVSATAIAAQEGPTFDAVAKEIRETRPRAHPHPKLRLNAYAYLVNQEGRSEARTQFEELAKDTRIGRSNDTTLEELLSTDPTR